MSINLELIKNHQLTTESKIQELESKLLTQPQADCPVTHHFGPGIYIREVRIKAGIFSIGHYQKTEHLNIMIKGRVLFLDDDGTVKDLKAPLTFVSKPGRKVGLILEDMIWQNVYATTERDIEKLEETYLNKSESWKYDYEAKFLLKKIQHEEDRQDYIKMLSELDVSEKQVREESENEEDLISFIENEIKIKVSDSPIEGKGLFSIYPFKENEQICIANFEGKRTPAGRYTNHSKYPNARMAWSGKNIILIANRPIRGCEGGDDGEEITIDYRNIRELRSQLCQV